MLKAHFMNLHTKVYRPSGLASTGRKVERIADLAPCTLHLSCSHGDRWGATDIATLSLHLILFSASLRALQNFNPVYAEILLSQRFFCRPLLLPPCTVPCKIVSASPADLDTRPNHFNLRFFFRG